MKNEPVIYGIENAFVNKAQMHKSCELFGVDINKPIPMLAYGEKNLVGKEIRHYYFDLARTESGYLSEKLELRFTPAGEKIMHHLPVTRIFSFGTCNVQCPYCKRDCQFIDDKGRPIVAIDVKLESLYMMAETAIGRGEIIRFSGGDPVMFQKVCLALSWYVNTLYGKKTSIAHNGSGPKWVKEMLPFMDSAAIDLKAIREKMGKVMGISEEAGKNMYRKSLETQSLFSDPKINSGRAILDVRTPVFGDTSLTDMMRLGIDICKGDPRTVFWTWRLYKKVEGCDWLVPDKEPVIEMLTQVSAAFPEHWMGIRAKWNGGGMLYFRAGKVVNPTENFETNEAIGSGNFKTCTD